MSKPSPYQPTFAEAEEIAANPDLQQLLEWYPDQEQRILAAHRRRQRPFNTACSCPKCTARRPRTPAHRPKTPSTTGSYREQLHR